MPKIPLADDDPFLIQIYSTKLTRDGYEVISAGDGQVALDKIKETKPDLIVLDIMLPKLNGLDVLSAVKEDKQLSKIPVIILSNLTHTEEQAEAKRRGATEFLAKIQYTPSQVISTIQKYLPVQAGLSKPTPKSGDTTEKEETDTSKKK